MSAPQDIVLITGAGSGIGRGLARAFHARGAQVIAAGRSLPGLRETASGCDGMAVELVDVADAASITALAGRIAQTHPRLNMVISNAGLQQVLDFRAGAVDPARIALEVQTNLTGLIQTSAAFLPLLQRQEKARLVHVGSTLAYVPLAQAPVYSATKSAVHSFSISLRQQLKGTDVQVVEIIPPAVETALHRGQDRKPPGALPLETFISAAMAGLESGRDEVAVGLARVLRIMSRVAPGLFLKIVN